MAIWGRVHNAVDATVIPRVAADGLYSESVTALIIKARAINHMGPQGDDIEGTWQTELARGRSYRGAPEQGAVIDTGEPVSSRFLWAAFEADIVIRGSDIRHASGLTTRQVLADQEPESVPDSDMRKLYNIGEEAVENAHRRCKAQLTSWIWERYFPDDRPEYAPEGLPTLFDETADWGGLPPSGLGSWNDGRISNPWGAVGPPNTLSGDAHNYRNVPQVFQLSGDPTISESELNEINLVMSSSVPGYWIAPLHHKDFATLTQKSEGNLMIPMTVGYSMWKKPVTFLQYNRTFYYVDNEATEGEVKNIHIGEMNPMSKDPRVGFCMHQWVPPQLEEIMSEMPPPNPAQEPGYNLGYNTMLPVWMDEFDRSQSQTDTIYSHMRYSLGFSGLDRWKNYVIRGFSVS